VWARLDHDSDTGLALRDARHVRVAPADHVSRLRSWLDREPVVDFRFTAALSANPVVRFPLRARAAGTLRVEFTDSEGRRWATSEPVRPAGT
jgi:hypothetical protein